MHINKPQTKMSSTQMIERQWHLFINKLLRAKALPGSKENTTIKHLGSLAILLGLSIAFAASGTEGNTLASSFHTAMTNTVALRHVHAPCNQASRPIQAGL